MIEEFEGDYCSDCGRNLNESVSGCPTCNSCGGVYAPGTEECGWCAYSEECEWHPGTNSEVMK